MVKEDYVSFETAKLLKNKGYNCGSKFWYNDKGIVSQKYIDQTDNPLGLDSHFACPTLQMARKWLREDKNVDIEISVYSKGFDGTLTYCADVLAYGNRLIMGQPIIYATYEQTCEKAIQYALKNVLTFENVKMEIHDVAGKDSIMPKVILNDFIRKKKKHYDKLQDKRGNY